MPSLATRRPKVAVKTRTPKAVARTGVRAAARGDIAPSTGKRALENFVAAEATEAAQRKKIAALEVVMDTDSKTPAPERANALRAILEGASSDDLRVLRSALLNPAGAVATNADNPDEELLPDWRDGGYPYRNLMRRSTYEKEKFHLQVELLKLQAWAKETGQRIVILFEGRDAAGKGGTIKRFMEHLNPRGAHVVALEKPSENGARTVVFPALRSASADAGRDRAV